MQIDAHHPRSKRQFNPQTYKTGRGAGGGGWLVGMPTSIKFFQNIEKKETIYFSGVETFLICQLCVYHFCRWQNTCNPRISPLQRVLEEKDLGVTISSNLSWDSHVSRIVLKAIRMLGLLKTTCPLSRTLKSGGQFIYLSWNHRFPMRQWYGLFLESI